MSLDPKTLQQLSAYLDDALTLREKSDVDVLLHRNPEARQALAALKTLREGVKKLPPMTPPETFYARVWRNIDAAPPPERRPAWTFAPVKLAGALAATLLVVVATHDFWRSPAVKQRDFAKMAEEAPSPLQMIQSPLGAEQALQEKESSALPGLPPPGAPALEAKDVAGAAAPRSAIDERAQPALGDQRQRLDAAEDDKRVAGKPPSAAAPLVLGGGAASAGAGLRSIGESGLDGLKKSKNEMRPLPAAAPAEPARESAAFSRPESITSLAGKSDAASSPPAAPAASSWRGYQSGVRTFETAAVRSSAEWAALWARHAPRAPLPVVDFEKVMVVAVFAGEKPTGGHAAAILSASPRDGQLVVAYRISAPAPDAFTTQTLTTPYHLMAVPRSDLPVVFEAK